MAMAVVAILSIACMTSDGSTQAAPRDTAKIQTIEIEHVIPKRDAVGPLPTRLEWTAVKDVDSYAIKVEDEIEIPVFDQQGITGTTVPWPPGLRIPPGTYFWRIVGIKGNRVIADSGRAAFVVRE
jgi:hypothetical protein